MKRALSIEKTNIDGLYIVNSAIDSCDGDIVLNTFNAQIFRNYGLNLEFVQENQSESSKGVLRGLHIQVRHPQGKLIRVIEGTIYDVAVDTRPNSATYGNWFGMEISSANKKQLYIPEGFAHGFYVLSNKATVCYKVSDYWYPDDEIGIPWNDLTLGIDWPIEESTEPIIAEKDSHYEPFAILRDKLI